MKQYHLNLSGSLGVCPFDLRYYFTNIEMRINQATTIRGGFDSFYYFFYSGRPLVHLSGVNSFVHGFVIIEQTARENVSSN